MKLLILLAMGIVTSLHAAEGDKAPFPMDAQAIMDQLDHDIAKLKQKAQDKLQKVIDRETKAGHLDSAVAVRNVQSSLNTRIKPDGDSIETLLISKHWKFYWQGLKGPSKIMKFSKAGIIADGGNFGENSYKIKDGTIIFINQNGDIQSILHPIGDDSFETGDTSDSAWKDKCLLIPIEEKP